MIKIIDNFLPDPYCVKRESFKSKIRDNRLTHPGTRKIVPTNIENLVLTLLKKELNETSDYINVLVARLNGSKNTDDVRWYNDLIKTQRDKKTTIENILNKIKIHFAFL